MWITLRELYHHALEDADLVVGGSVTQVGDPGFAPFSAQAAAALAPEDFNRGIDLAVTTLTMGP
eukprot:9657887-Lingulodinium_polyedra.AAC.1